MRQQFKNGVLRPLLRQKYSYIGEFDRGAILNKKPVSTRSDMRAKRTSECDTRKVTTVLPEFRD